LSGAGSFKDSGFKQDLQRLTYWYLDHGYVKFRYENPVVTVSDDKKWLYISIYVEEGEQYNMGAQEFSGDLLFSKEELAEDVTLKKDDTFKISKRNADIQKLTEKYQDLGYAFVNVIPKMNIHDETRTVDIDYYFEKGNLAYFGEIWVVGNSKTHDKVIRRELRVHEGELFNGTNFRISKERVERLGFFQPGEVIFNQITRKGTDNIVDLEITVKERSTGSINLGAGYGSQSKFFLTTQISEINLMGRGQILSFQATYAADRIAKSFNLGFTEPYTLDTKWSTGADVFFMTFKVPGKYLMRKLGFDLRVGYPLTDDVSAYITYKNEGLAVVDRFDPEIDSSLDEGVLSSVI
jgi:outer membrane protein insertion porin family